ncbi:MULTISPECIES: hypothetical protein [Parachlamydia]|jgi:hypothetical protein|uniref:Exo-alpha-sialidase n=2 Tax=Parachlamydia acanthamoebae TaxID=83552 RepID=F8KXG2_PARAV|nr:hypothetical protein [Parachlamydia acanthamoebae]EFB42528.1 hypothetical protein pah_c004o011 [Parachlamydia acanthamoebae str. Hall's coccus]CCB86999.1 putative uncharacterized protein [Parachlamydia acanthamoebae UV-7]
MAKSKKKKVSKPHIIALRKIWDQSLHNALTDLIDFQGRFFCVFRESDSHAAGVDGTIRILTSANGEQWITASILQLKGIDLRDPHFGLMPDGRLYLIMGGSIYQGEKLIAYRSYATFSKDGVHWDPIQSTGIEEEWIWRVTWHKGIGYGISYHLTDLEDLDQPWEVKLFKTQDGIHFQLVSQLDVSSFPSESTLRFLSNDTMVALMRRDGNGWIGHALPPYKKWKWKESDYRIGGPNFLVFPNDQMWSAARLVKEIDKETKERTTVLASMTLKDFQPMLVFPSGGDNSYPGMVFREGKLYVSYYSSHEEKSAIYFAEVSFTK